jgi:hypothetical protein
MPCPCTGIGEDNINKILNRGLANAEVNKLADAEIKKLTLTS